MLPTPCAAGAAAGQSTNGVNGPGEEGSSWAQGGFPSYLQNQRNKRFPCEGEAVASGPADKTRWKREIQIWETVRCGGLIPALLATWHRLEGLFACKILCQQIQAAPRPTCVC